MAFRDMVGFRGGIGLWVVAGRVSNPPLRWDKGENFVPDVILSRFEVPADAGTTGLWRGWNAIGQTRRSAPTVGMRLGLTSRGAAELGWVAVGIAELLL